MTSRQVRLGLVGAGRWGRNCIRTLASLPGVRLAALASRNPASAALVPEGCPVEPDWRSILDPSRLDGVIVASPPATHAEIAHAAVEVGLPVLVEKPLTLDAAQARALRDHAVRRDALVRVDHTHLYHPAFRALKDAAARAGRLVAMQGLAGNHGPFRDDAPVLWDWGAHDLAMAIDLAGGPPTSIQAVRIEPRETPAGAGEVVDIEATFPGGAAARLRMGNVLDKARRFTAYTEQATFVYDDLAAGKLTAHPPAAAFERPTGGQAMPCGSELPLACAVREFAESIVAANRSTRDLDIGVQVVEALEACARLASEAVARTPR